MLVFAPKQLNEREITININRDQQSIARALERARRGGLALLLCAPLLTGCVASDVQWVDVPLPEDTYYDVAREYRSDTVEIPVAAGEALEYMLNMRNGDAVSYSWIAANLNSPESLLIEFHGHTIRETEAPGDLVFYNQLRGSAEDGYMVAPFDGSHGWYFANESDADITISLTLSGFYELE